MNMPSIEPTLCYRIIMSLLIHNSAESQATKLQACLENSAINIMSGLHFEP